MRFGAHVNANTSFDQTVYQLQIPTDDANVIDRSFLVLEDWATGVTFEADEIDKERGVVLEEWRLGLGADARLLQTQLPVLLKGSRYAERLPIGTPESIRTFAPERLKQFYKDWYRPDLMAVIAVGDFDKAAVEALIKTHFARIPAATSPQAAAALRRARASRHALHHRHRSRGDGRPSSTCRARSPRATRRRSAPIASRPPSASSRACCRPASASCRRSRTRRSSPPAPTAACSCRPPR